MPNQADPPTLTSCHCCGLIQQLPDLQAAQAAFCRRCDTELHHSLDRWQKAQQASAWSYGWACAGLFCYLPGIFLPIVRVEKLGHLQQDSIWTGVVYLLAAHEWVLALIILLFSIVLPALKLALLLLLSSNGRYWLLHQQRALVFQLVESLGRWGMLDVLLVAVLVAFIKVGDLVTITAGPGLVAFSACVICSLLASISFDAHLLWEEMP